MPRDDTQPQDTQPGTDRERGEEEHLPPHKSERAPLSGRPSALAALLSKARQHR
jgi:hypothetical protein